MSEPTEVKATETVTVDATAPPAAEASEPTAAPSAEATKSDADVPMTDNEAEAQLKTVRQLEFYFADSNLPYDRFMWQLHTANAEHWVSLATVASFKRMREHATRGLPWVAAAVRAKSTALEVDEKGENIRRTTEVSEPKDQFERSVYAKGFGEEKPGLQDKLEQFFNQFGRCNAVRMRRDEAKAFKGSVFAEFADFATVKTFLEADPKPQWEGKELLIMSKGDYCEMKIKEKGLTGAKAQARRESMSAGVGRKGFNAFKEMASKDTKEAKEKGKPEVYLDFLGNRVRVYEGEDGRGTVKEEEVPVVTGVTLRFDGCGGDCQFDQIKAPLKERFARAPHVGYERGSDFGFVGFDKPLSDEEVAFVKETLKQINGKDVSWRPADEEEERAQQLSRAQFAASRALTSSPATRGGAKGGRGGRGGRGGGRGGRGGKRGSAGGDKKPAAEKKGENGAAEDAGTKRKRGVEPDGGLHVGERNVGVPSLVSAAKKQKTEA